MKCLIVVLCATVALCAAWVPDSKTFMQFRAISRAGVRIDNLNLNAAVQGLFDDEDDGQTFKDIAEKYLLNKYRVNTDQEKVSSILQSILPPVSKIELDKEISLLQGKFRGEDSVSDEEFVAAVLDNTYWTRAGALVVKELIFLDCIHSYYYNKQAFLEDDEYNELKEMLTWEGSSVATMSGKEALFVTAVAASRRGNNLLSDAGMSNLKTLKFSILVQCVLCEVEWCIRQLWCSSIILYSITSIAYNHHTNIYPFSNMKIYLRAEYSSLKAELKASNSWVTAREMDGLEKHGIQTWHSYLTSSLNEDEE